MQECHPRILPHPYLKPDGDDLISDLPHLDQTPHLVPHTFFENHITTLLAISTLSPLLLPPLAHSSIRFLPNSLLFVNFPPACDLRTPTDYFWPVTPSPL